MNPRRRLFVTIFAALLFFAPALGGISTDFHNADTDALLTRPRPLPLGHLDVSPGIERVWSASNDPGLSKRACNRSIRRDPVPRREMWVYTFELLVVAESTGGQRYFHIYEFSCMRI